MSRDYKESRDYRESRDYKELVRLIPKGNKDIRIEDSLITLVVVNS